MKAWRFISHFALSYLRCLPRILYRTTLSCILDPKGSQRFLHDVMAARDPLDDRVMGTVDLHDLIPGGGDVLIQGPYTAADTSETRNVTELACLAHIVRQTQAKTIFEFGTFIGRTTRLLALNAAPDAKVYTMDLPRQRVPHDIGKDYRGTPEASRIEQLHEDSLKFDPSRWRSSCDFIWVDACHDYEFVKADTENALKMIRPGGWIGWHDYRWTQYWCGVTRYLRELRLQFPQMRHVRGTTIVLAQIGAK